jgi:hypothetical protein
MNSIKTLLIALQNAPTLQGVSVVYGEELIATDQSTLPLVVIVPDTFTYTQEGYQQDQPKYSRTISRKRQLVHLYCWAIDPLNTPIDNTNAMETLEQQVHQALAYQRSNAITSGIMWFPKGGKWQLMGGAFTRYGRGMVIDVDVEISVPDIIPEKANIAFVKIISETIEEN